MAGRRPRSTMGRSQAASLGLRLAAAATAWLAILPTTGQAQIMSVDLGHEFFKVALMRQGKPLEIVLNPHSKRKSSTAVSYFESIRVFGDDAVAHAGKAPAKVPMFFHSLMGLNFTSPKVVEAGGEWWTKFGLGDRFYSYQLGYNEERGVPTLTFLENATEFEEALAGVLVFAKMITEDTTEGKPVRDLVVTVAPDCTLRQRQAIVAAGEIAGLRVLTLVHEGSAFAVQRAVDFTPKEGESALVLLYNLGSRKAEATVVRFSSRSTGMVAGKVAPVVSVLGSAVDYNLGGHLMDLKIADVMLKRFQEKYPKFADGIAENSKAKRKMLSQAQKTKAILSSNKNAPFIVESVYEDTDFQATISREEFEVMCQDMLDRLTDPIDKALEIANVTLSDIAQVEVVGGAWRVPKVQQLLSDFLGKDRQEKLPLGQHLNGEEAAALGAALVAANSSKSFRVKKIFFTDITNHEYSVQVVGSNGEWERNITTLYSKGTALGGKKKLAFQSEENFAIRVFEDGLLQAEYAVTGVSEALEGDWKEYNMTGSPKISATVPLEMSGIIEVKAPTMTVEALIWVNATVKKSKNVTSVAANASEGAAKEEPAASETEESEGEEKATEEDKAEENATAEESSTAENATKANATKANATKANATEDEYEVVLKQKKEKYRKELKLTRIDFKPLPLVDATIAELREKLKAVALREEEVKGMVGIKNELEAAIYGSREKMENEDVMKVSTEEQREEVTKLCTELEDWMLEPTTTKSEYEQRLTKLQDLMAPIEERALELEQRDGLAGEVESGIEGMRSTHKYMIDKNMSAWVSEDKIEKALEKLDKFEEWWKKKVEQQDKLPLHDAPAFTKKEVVEKMTKLQDTWDKLKKTPKPKAKKETKKANATKSAKADGAKGSSKTEDSASELSSDPVVIEKELEAVREKKTNAVANEDFDAAHELKKREALLVKHLETLASTKSEL